MRKRTQKVPAPEAGGSMQSYIVRIYRRAASPEPEVTGTVESPESGRHEAFHSFAELTAILACGATPGGPSGQSYRK